MNVVVCVEVVGPWGDLDVFGGQIGVPLFEGEEAELGAVEVFTVRYCVYGCSGGDGVCGLWCR